jgi:hypothetical protein
MPKKCSICVHQKRKEIESAILEGKPLRLVASRFSVSEDALSRHKLKHIIAALAKAQEIREVAMAGTLLEQLRSLQEKALELLYRAEAAGGYRTALAGVREARGSLEVLVQAMSKLREDAPVQQQVITFSPAEIGESLRGLLAAGALALPEGDRDRRQENDIIEGSEMNSGEEDRCSEPPPQIG